MENLILLYHKAICTFFATCRALRLKPKETKPNINNDVRRFWYVNSQLLNSRVTEIWKCNDMDRNVIWESQKEMPPTVPCCNFVSREHKEKV